MLSTPSLLQVKEEREQQREERWTVEELGKDLGNCTHQWTTNDDTNTQVLLILRLLQAKEEKQQQKEERVELVCVLPSRACHDFGMFSRTCHASLLRYGTADAQIEVHGAATVADSNLVALCSVLLFIRNILWCNT